jgi:hypothetical protein
MIFQLADAFPPDATERSLPDAASGLACMARERPELLTRLRARHSLWAARFGPAGDGRIAGVEAALLLGIARLGQRHGRYGNDFHAYHNEEHALDLLLGRIDRLYAHPAASRLGHEDWLALELFAAHHDLRQREHGSHAWDPVGANEAASIAESRRILAACGFSEEREQALYHALELMIAGSTFDVRPPQPNDPVTDPEGADNSADLASGGGALAPRLLPWMQQNHPLQASRACIARGTRDARRPPAGFDPVRRPLPRLPAAGPDPLPRRPAPLRLSRRRGPARRRKAAQSAAHAGVDRPFKRAAFAVSAGGHRHRSDRGVSGGCTGGRLKSSGAART